MSGSQNLPIPFTLQEGLIIDAQPGFVAAVNELFAIANNIDGNGVIRFEKNPGGNWRVTIDSEYMRMLGFSNGLSLNISPDGVSIEEIEPEYPETPEEGEGGTEEAETPRIFRLRGFWDTSDTVSGSISDVIEADSETGEIFGKACQYDILVRDISGGKPVLKYLPLCGEGEGGGGPQDPCDKDNPGEWTGNPNGGGGMGGGGGTGAGDGSWTGNPGGEGDPWVNDCDMGIEDEIPEW